MKLPESNKRKVLKFAKALVSVAFFGAPKGR